MESVLVVVSARSGIYTLITTPSVPIWGQHPRDSLPPNPGILCYAREMSRWGFRQNKLTTKANATGE